MFLLCMIASFSPAMWCMYCLHHLWQIQCPYFITSSLTCGSIGLLFFIGMYSSSSVLISSSSLATLSTYAIISSASSSLKSKYCSLSISGAGGLTCTQSSCLWWSGQRNAGPYGWSILCGLTSGKSLSSSCTNQFYPCFCCSQPRLRV